MFYRRTLKKILSVIIILFVTFFTNRIDANAYSGIIDVNTNIHNEIININVLSKLIKKTEVKQTKKITIGTKKQTTVSSFIKKDGTSDICDNEKGLGRFVGKYWKMIIFALPFLLIVLTTFDFFKAVVSSNADALKKSSNTALKRALIAIILLCLPFIINTIFGEWFKICL